MNAAHGKPNAYQSVITPIVLLARMMLLVDRNLNHTGGITE
jgi:hypothetical protein